jgi:phage shock protein PspC (stress-responsive transcriptional regulator)
MLVFINKKAGAVIFMSGICLCVLACNNYFYSMKTVKDLMERSAFGVCTYLGDKMGLASARVRMYFIYLSFVALGSPIIVYLFVAFWLNIKQYIKNSRTLRWE